MSKGTPHVFIYNEGHGDDTDRWAAYGSPAVGHPMERIDGDYATADAAGARADQWLAEEAPEAEDQHFPLDDWK